MVGTITENLMEQIGRTEQRFEARKDERERKKAILGRAMPNIVMYREVDTTERVNRRLSMINKNDGLGKERIINGKNDIVEVNYLDIGLGASQSVCRIEVRDMSGEVLGHGTGFLVSPSLILTNNHVLERKEHAQRSLAQFHYESDSCFLPKNTVSFLLEPDRFFATDKHLDFTLVAVRSVSTAGTPLSKFGFLKLIEQTGKVLVGEYLTAIHHPNGGLKCVTLRENRIVCLLDSFIHYETDTLPGSSGSPMFNDQWQVVALHHCGVPVKVNGKEQSVDGGDWDPSMGEAKIAWKANEGVRVSTIIQHLASHATEFIGDQRKLLDQLRFALPETGALAPVSALSRPSTTGPGMMEIAERTLSSYGSSKGYNPEFLQDYSIPLPLPTVDGDLEEDFVTESVTGGFELKYTNFSVIMSKSRRLAYVSAVNIDGSDRQNIPRDSNRWYFDPRIDRKYQCGPELYEDNDLDRGHLVRRLDPVWGMEAHQANEDTFHFTNCSPQHRKLNRETWVGLEDYIRDNARLHGLKVNVFTGPVFRNDDMIYKGEFQIPAEFWKVVTVIRDDGKLSATAYLQTQKNLIQDLEFAYGQYRTYQVPITRIEALTGLNFEKVRSYDPLAFIEGTVGRVIDSMPDVRL